MRICPTCAAQNPDRARFCLECGTPLVPAQAAGEERRHVTVIFCDLAGFTARSDLADPEDVKAVLRPFHARLKREVESFGGTLDKFIGDGGLAVFGAPIAHEDDPERAVRAALRIQEAIVELNEETPGLELAARIGIDSGEAVVSLGRGPQIGESVTGDVVNTASRLQSIAPVGSIVVGEPTFRATQDRFVYEPLGDVSVRGKSAPLKIWRPVSPRSRLVREITGTPLVDREEELSVLQGVYRRAVSGHGVQLVTVTGEAGVGKSRVIAELARFLDDIPEITRWRAGRCLPYGEGVSFAPFAEMVTDEAGILASDAPDAARAKLSASVASLIDDPTERASVFAGLAPLVALGDGPADADADASFAAWRRFAEAMALDHPTVLVFEDVHWADDALFELIEELVDRAAQVPLIMICAARPELYDRRPSWGGGMRNSSTVWVRPLSDEQTGVLLRELMPETELPGHVRDAIVDRSGGIPLYAEELVHMLGDSGYVDPSGALRLPQPDGIELPSSVHALIGARLDTFPGAWRSLLQAAAVVGRTFWSGALAEIAGVDEPDVAETLRQIAQKQLIQPVRASSVEGQAEYRFRHAFIRDVVYGRIPRAARAEMHLGAARWLERIAGERSADAAELLAYHFAEALDLASSTRTSIRLDELRPIARRFLMLAGDRARRLDVAKAETYYRRASDLLDPDDPERARVLVQIAETNALQGRYDDAERGFEEAIAALRAIGDRPALGEALGLFSRAAANRGEAALARELVDEAIAVLEGCEAGPELVRVYNRKAAHLLFAGDSPTCVKYCELALPLARQLEMDDEVVRALETMGAARSDLGDAGGLDDLREAVRYGLEAGVGVEVALAYGNLAYQLWLREGPSAALPVWRDMRAFSEGRGLTSEAMWARLGHLETLFDMGDWDTVLSIARELVDWGSGRGASAIGTYSRLFEGWVLLRRGETEAVAALIDEVLPRARRAEYAEHLAPALMIAAEVERLRGDDEAAVAHVEEFVALTEAEPNFRLMFLPVATRVLVGAGRVERAETTIGQRFEVTSERTRLSLLSAKAILAEATRDHRAAADLYAEAAEGWERYGFPLEHANALIGLGRCRLQLGDAEAAGEALARGRELVVGLGYQAAVDEADALLVGGGVRTVGAARPITPSGPVGRAGTAPGLRRV